MSRYPAADYRAPRDRSRSPPRFTERRQSAASIFDNRPPGPLRSGSDAPRGPRSQFDGPRPSLPGGPGSSGSSRPSYTSLREAPPLGSGDRGRPYREREYERRERVPSRERSPARNFKDSRDYPPRDLDVDRARRGSRDGPPSAGSTYSDSQSFSSAAFRGGLSRGRGRGEYSFRGGRGVRANLDERDLFRRERSPPPRWGGRNLSRDDREPDRRDERRFERREEDRKPAEWTDRERDREPDRSRRDQPAPRLESRQSNESLSNANTTQAPAPPINPARLALIESTGADTSVRRPSIQQDAPSRDNSSYLNGRMETTANRYGSRGSSPPTQAPPVPAFTLSFAPAAAPTASSTQASLPTQPATVSTDSKAEPSQQDVPMQDAAAPAEEQRPDPPADAPIAPRLPPAAPKAQLASPPLAAPRAPRALETADDGAPFNRLQGVRSLETLSAPGAGLSRAEGSAAPAPVVSQSTSGFTTLPTLIEPVSPQQTQRAADLGAPTGPRATRMSPAKASVSPRPPFASPRSDMGGFQAGHAMPRTQTPPPSAPSGPRNRSYSVSPKVASSAVPTAPTAPKGNRGPPLAPRGPERTPLGPGRAPDRLGAPPPWAPPSAPRGLQWNQWRRPGAPALADKSIPAKRDFAGEEKGRPIELQRSDSNLDREGAVSLKSEEELRRHSNSSARQPGQRPNEEIDDGKHPPKRQQSLVDHGHNAARSFFGKPVEKEGEDEEEEKDEENDVEMSEGQEPASTSDDDESDMEEDLTLFHAKFERQKRQIEAKKVDLSTRHYRATTPLESIARLHRISAKDLQRINEQREHEMDVDQSPVTRPQHQVPATTHSSDSGEVPDVLTPKGGDDRRVEIRGSDDSSDSVRRIRRPTPEPVSLPYLLKGPQSPLHESEAFQATVKRHEETKADVLDGIDEDNVVEEDDLAEAENEFDEEFRRWREECENYDRIVEEQEKLERQQSIEPGPELEVPLVLPANPFEGRRLHKFSSEYEIEQVLKQSEETARIEQERQDREARKNEADLQKEAHLPDQQTAEEIRRTTFVDSNRYREPESLSLVFSYRPPKDTFNETEQQIFIAAFKETPKKWGEIASLLPGRTYEDCIRHYYAYKWDGRFRDNRTKKLKAGGRRPRGGARGPRGRVGGLMADLARAEDFMSTDVSEKGRPRRAAAPTTFAEKEAEAKASLVGPSPAKKPGPSSKSDTNGEGGSEKPGKRQKRNGDKPGRKTKANQPLAALAAAPQASPGKQFLPGVQSKEDLARAQKLEEASLLANLQGGHLGMHQAEGQMVYAQDAFMQGMAPPEDSERLKSTGQGPPPKQSASSYWSVPEQNDFVKYIGYFGRDFAAIANHMGTKTQTMIKNHYQRQVDGGNRPELEKAAIEADERRNRGEDMGTAPTPTPIVKRKYENPQPSQSQPRPIVPHGDVAETDEPAPPQRAPVQKHASPPQYQSQPRFTTSAQNTPVPAARVAPSPLASAAAPATNLPSSSRPQHHPLGSSLAFVPTGSRSEARSAPQPAPGFRAARDSPPRNEPTQPQRAMPMADEGYLRGLVQEQERAMQMQKQYPQHAQPSQQERIEQLQRQTTFHRNSSQGSPFRQPLHNPPIERKASIEERPPSPPRSTFSNTPFSRPPLGISTFGPLGPTPFSSLAGRSFNPSPSKRDDSRPGSVTTAPAPSAPPAEPKRSNVMSLLNAEEDEPKPPKRESLPSAQIRTSSPASHNHPHVTSAAPLSSIPALGREPSFGQPSMPQPRFHRGSFGQQSSTPGPVTQSIKHEPPQSGVQTPTQDWAAKVLEQQQHRSTPTHEREARSYYPHSHRASLLGSLGQQRANPSPPPIVDLLQSRNAGDALHSRKSSLSASSYQALREQSKPGQTGQQQPLSHQTGQPLQPNPYASQQPSPFPQQRSGPASSQSHHSHHGSLSGPFPSLHQRNISRDDHVRLEQAQREREREEQHRWSSRERIELGRPRRPFEELRQEQEQERQQHGMPRQAPQSLQHPIFSGSAFNQNGSLDLRGQSRMEAERMLLEEQERARVQQQQDADRKIREREQADDFRRRHEESMFPRRTPLGGGYSIPPAPPRR